MLHDPIHTVCSTILLSMVGTRPYDDQYATQRLVLYTQASLLQHNEHEALSPKKLQQKVIELLSSSPDLAEAVSLVLQECCVQF